MIVNSTSFGWKSKRMDHEVNEMIICCSNIWKPFCEKYPLNCSGKSIQTKRAAWIVKPISVEDFCSIETIRRFGLGIRISLGRENQRVLIWSDNVLLLINCTLYSHCSSHRINRLNNWFDYVLDWSVHWIDKVRFEQYHRWMMVNKVLISLKDKQMNTYAEQNNETTSILIHIQLLITCSSFSNIIQFPIQ